MVRRRLASALLVAGILIASGAVACAQPKALLELFTSQGCSSCPPADKLLAQFAADPSVVALSLPIDIWDYLGWKDTLALAGHAARQRAYASLRRDREVYTPQMIVNGSMHVLGSDRAAIEKTIAETDHNPQIMSLPVLLSVGGGDLSVTVKAAATGQGGGEVWLCPVSREIPVVIGRGENRGRTVTYHNVVRGWRKLGEFTGRDTAWQIPLSEIEAGNIDAAAVMVQKGTHEKPGIVLGAALVRLGRRTVGGRQATEK
jgi:hypothetical protein